jgi:hypothetical protein
LTGFGGLQPLLTLLTVPGQALTDEYAAEAPASETHCELNYVNVYICDLMAPLGASGFRPR